MSNKTAAVAAVIVHKVEDWDKWKAAFDAHGDTRKGASVLGHHINRSVDDPNLLAVYLPASDGDALKSMIGSADLKAKMQEAGVAGPPTISFVTPVEDLTDKRDLPGAMIRHTVKDFDIWKAAYDKHMSTRRDGGIVGDAVNRSADKANEVIAYLQAESHEALQKFLSSDDLKAAMQEAGVVGAPEISIWNGGDWAQY